MNLVNSNLKVIDLSYPVLILLLFLSAFCIFYIVKKMGYKYIFILLLITIGVSTISFFYTYIIQNLKCHGFPFTLNCMPYMNRQQINPWDNYFNTTMFIINTLVWFIVIFFGFVCLKKVIKWIRK